MVEKIMTKGIIYPVFYLRGFQIRTVCNLLMIF